MTPLVRRGVEGIRSRSRSVIGRRPPATVAWLLVLVALAPLVLMPVAAHDVVFNTGFLRLGPLRRSSVLTFFGCIALSLLTWAIAARRASVRWLVGTVSSFGLVLSLLNGSFTSFGSAVLTFSCVLAVGRALNSTLLRSLPDGIRNQPIVHCAVGFAVVQNVLFLLGWIGWLTKPFGALVLLVGLIALRSNHRELGERSAGFLDVRSGRYGAMSVALLTLPVWIWLGAPDVQFDAIYAKGWLPRLWASTGSIEVLTQHPVLGTVGSNLTLAVPGHLFGAHDTGRFLQFGCGVLVALTPLWLAGRNRRRVMQACLTAIIIASSGHVLWQMTTAYDDLLVLVPFVAVLLVAFASRDRLTPAAGFAVGLLGAAALSSKLYLAPFAFLIVAFCLVRSEWRTWATLAFGGAAGAGMPMAMRWFETGNPVFPQYNALFHSRFFPPISTTWNMPFDKRSGMADAFLIPFRAVSEPWRLVEVAPPGSFGVLVVGFGALVVGLVVAKDRRPFVILALWAILWWFQLRYLRYALPLLVTSTLLVSMHESIRVPARLRAVLVRPRPSRALGWLASALLGALVGGCLLSAIAGFWNIPERLPVRAAFGRESDDAYLDRVFPQTSALQAVNRLASPGDRLIGDAHGRNLLRMDVDLSPSWEGAGEVALAGGPTTTPLAQQFRRRGFRWAIVSAASRVAGTPSIPNEVLRYPENLAWAGRGYELFEIGGTVRVPTLQCQVAVLLPTQVLPCGRLRVESVTGGLVVTSPCRGSTILLEANPVAPGGNVDVATRSGGILTSFMRYNPSGRLSAPQTVDLPGSTLSVTGIEMKDLAFRLLSPCD